MYAVIETGGKQYRVELGSELEIDRLDASPGDTIELGRVLLVADTDSSQIGRPVIDGAKVSASVVRQDRGDKIVVFKYRPKARTRVKHGHRQDLTVVRIADIEFDGRSAAREAESQAQQEERERAAAAAAAERQAAADRALAEKLAREQAEAEAAAKPEQSAPKAARTRTKRAAATATTESSAGTEPVPTDAAVEEADGGDQTTTDMSTKPTRAKTKKDE
jgi:large subunit ribosomal protein L21